MFDLQRFADDIPQELAAYRERYGSLNAQPQQSPQENYQQPPQQQAAPPIQNLTEDMIKNFEDAITYGAKQLSGFSDEQVD